MTEVRTAKVQTSVFPAGMKGQIDVSGMPRRDLAKAKEYLAKSAYPNGGISLDYYHIAGLEEARDAGSVHVSTLRTPHP